MTTFSLKNHSITEIQDTIAKALSELVGKPVEIEIGSVEFDESQWTTALTRFSVKMSEKDLFGDRAPAEDEGRF